MLDSKFDFTDADQCLTHKESIMAIDLMQYHGRILDDFYEYLKPRQPGLYLVNKLTPVIDLTGQFIDSQTGAAITSMKQLLEVTGSVTGPDGAVYSRKQIHLLHSATTRRQDIYTSAIQLLKDFADYYLTQPLRYPARTLSPGDTISRYFTEYPETVLQTENLEDYLQHRLEDLCLTLNTFLDRDYWKLHFTKLVGTTYYIEKGVDYRIWEFYKQHDSDTTD